MTVIKPTKIKLAFVLPWILYLAMELYLGYNILIPVSGLTLLLLYFAGGIAEVVEARWGGVIKGKFLLPMVLVLVGVDHLAKLAVVLWLPKGAQVTLVPGSYSLSQVHNHQAAWLPNKFNWDVPLLLLSLVAVLMLYFTFAAYKYYTGVHGRKNTFTDLAVLLVMAGALSALGDQVFRGYTVDFIQFHGFFVADTKDFYLTLGIGAVLAECFLSPVEDGGLRAFPGMLKRVIIYSLKGKA